jgi:dTDP-glucose 4,6-dehydratase
MNNYKRIIVTGGAGFIGSALVKKLVYSNVNVLNIDKLTYAGNLSTLDEIKNYTTYKFIRKDICDNDIYDIISDFKPDAILHLAAESHVDNSINSPEIFIKTNIFGTFNLLEAARKYYNSLTDNNIKEKFRFLLVSTDEVYGSLGKTGMFTEETKYDPRSPYSASKASADHLTMAWFHTFGLPILKTNCSNNYGYYQYPEKLIPKVIINAINEKPLPIYGKGDNIRDWLYVDDHCDAIIEVLNNGKIGETYNVGGRNEKTNLEVVTTICKILDEEVPRLNGLSYSNLITFVDDRLGHDKRYAIDPTKIENDINWHQKESFDNGIRKTIKWYINNESWWKKLIK